MAFSRHLKSVTLILILLCLALDKTVSGIWCLRKVNPDGPFESYVINSHSIGTNHQKHLIDKELSLFTKLSECPARNDINPNHQNYGTQSSNNSTHRVVVQYNIFERGTYKYSESLIDNQSIPSVLTKMMTCRENRGFKRSLDFIVSGCNKVRCRWELAIGSLIPNSSDGTDAIIHVPCNATKGFHLSDFAVKTCGGETGWSKVDLSRCHDRNEESRKSGNKRVIRRSSTRERIKQLVYGHGRPLHIKSLVGTLIDSIRTLEIDIQRGSDVLTTISDLLTFFNQYISLSEKLRLHRAAQTVAKRISLRKGSFHFQSEYLSMFVGNVSELLTGESLLVFDQIQCVRDSDMEGLYLVKKSHFPNPNGSCVWQGDVTIPIGEMHAIHSLLPSRLVVMAYRDGRIFNQSKAQTPNQNYTHINSIVVSVLLPESKEFSWNLSSNLTFRLRHIEKQSLHLQCMHWNIQLFESLARWADDNCTPVIGNSSVEYDENNEKTTICSCNRLGTFALLVNAVIEPAISKSDEKLLSYLVLIGCSISAASLLAVIVTYAVMNELRADFPGKLLFNLSITLWLTNVITIVNILITSSTDNALACKIIAVLLHFFLLSSFIWMALEGCFLYKAIVQVFFEPGENLVVRCAVVAFGLPLIIVISLCAVDFNRFYGRATAGRICFLKHFLVVYIAFEVPVAVILIFNCFIFLSVICQIRRMGHSEGGVRRIRRTFSLMFLLGLSWVFGFLDLVDTGTPVFAYLFAVCNSLHGFFILIFYCVLKRSVKDKWKSIRERRQSTMIRPKLSYSTSVDGPGVLNFNKDSKSGLDQSASNPIPVVPNQPKQGVYRKLCSYAELALKKF